MIGKVVADRVRRTWWWHETVLRHRLRQDVTRARMVTYCECGECWVTVGDPACAWTQPGPWS